MPEAKQTEGPASQRQHNEDRMRRARAWLQRSAQEETADIERFVFLWIAFNAAYGNEAALRDFVERQEEDRESESERFRTFLRNILREDRQAFWRRFFGTSFRARSASCYRTATCSDPSG